VEGIEVDGLASARPQYNRWLPYWAVYQADFHQTLRSWVYRVWVAVSVLAVVGFLLYRCGIAHETGIIQPASKLVGELLRWTALGSVTLIVALTAGCISSERGTLADSVLSRGISRHQYFLGKWHSRLTSVLVTFVVLASASLLASLFVLHEDLSLSGCAMAVVTVGALLAAVVTCGVTISAVCNSTALGVALLWVVLYGGGFALSLLPSRMVSPDRALAHLPHILQGHYDAALLGNLIGSALGFSFVVALAGLVYFARRDV
jgi:ABC-2 type transport system permease protein